MAKRERDGRTLTADTITDDQIRELAAELRARRQNAYTRAICKDCDGALRGSRACREGVAVAWNLARMQERLRGGKPR